MHTQLKRVKIFESEENAYSRHVIVYRTNMPCMKCGVPNTIEIDTSDDEYLSGIFCKPCLIGMFDAQPT